MTVTSTRKTPTMEQIAEMAGCSQPTVSFILNGKAASKKISTALQNSVNEIAERLGYQVQRRNRATVHRPTQTIGFMIPTVLFSYWPEVIFGAEDFLASQNYHLLLLQTGLNGSREIESLEQVTEFKIDALVISTLLDEEAIVPRLQKISSIMPVVLVGSQFESWECDSVTTSDLYGGRMATEHLLSQGYRPVAHLAGPQRTWAGRFRRLGYEDAVRAAGLPVDESLIVESEFDTREAYKAMSRLLEYARPKAVFAASDVQAMGAYFALADAGLHVPGDCAIVGYDDLDQSECFHVPLTSMRQPKAEYGALACHRALELIRNAGKPTGSPAHHQLMPQMVIRNSCGANSMETGNGGMKWGKILGV